jgi:hypothetical protein
LAKARFKCFDPVGQPSSAATEQNAGRSLASVAHKATSQDGGCGSWALCFATHRVGNPILQSACQHTREVAVDNMINLLEHLLGEPKNSGPWPVVALRGAPLQYAPV